MEGRERRERGGRDERRDEGRDERGERNDGAYDNIRARNCTNGGGRSPFT